MNVNPQAAWRRRKKSAEAIRAILVERFPKCFMPKGERKVPLKIGIYYDIRKLCPDLSSRKISRALSDYTSGRTYRRSMIAGACRLDLDGWPFGFVTTEEAEEARERLLKADRNVARKETLSVDIGALAP